MKQDRVTARRFVRQWAAAGRHSFFSEDARAALSISANATKLALNRLSHDGEIASPARGFYVIVPPEYRSLGCLPADQFIPALMERAGVAYYAALLSAAQFHGAAHQRPQEFQVMLEKPRRAIHCGRVSVGFFVRKRLVDMPLQNFNTPRGSIKVSTPEATAMDLVGYSDQAGGLDNVATILAELSERLDPRQLVVVANTAPIPWAQRLGYLLEKVGAAAKTAALQLHVKSAARDTVALLPSARIGKALRDSRWKLLVNADVEIDS